jgi:hypothetical protein
MARLIELLRDPHCVRRGEAESRTRCLLEG